MIDCLNKLLFLLYFIFFLFSIVLIGKFNRRIDFRLGCYSYPHKDEKAQIELNFLSNTVEN